MCTWEFADVNELSKSKTRLWVEDELKFRFLYSGLESLEESSQCSSFSHGTFQYPTGERSLQKGAG